MPAVVDRTEAPTLPPPPPGEELSTVDRYELGVCLGIGGMGTVHVARDPWLDREVALKRLRREPSPEEVSHFLDEARLQGRLAHPAIVPVHEIGVDATGRPFFTMKRVGGRALDEIVRRLADGDVATSASHGRRRLLGAFGQLCLAVEYAHTRGVVHSDLKPANVMLGDFGEVHVLDWGLAETGEANQGGESDSGVRKRRGSFAGTPGYIAPEVLRGHSVVTPRADVYALGAILFELLYLEPLHAQETPLARLTATMLGSDVPHARTPLGEAVPEELVRIVEDATELEPMGRTASARALSEAVQAWLDGDASRAVRASEADGEIASARSLVETEQSPDAALVALARAVALVPDHRDAPALLDAVLARLEGHVPPEAHAALEGRALLRHGDAARACAVRAGTWLLLAPVLAAFGVSNVPLAALTVGTVMATLGLSVYLGVRRTVDDGLFLALAALSALALGTMSLVFGPYLLVPALASTHTLFLAVAARPRLRVPVVLLGVASVVVPPILGLFGVLPAGFHDGASGLELRSAMIDLPRVAVEIFLLVASLASVVTPTLLAASARDRFVAAEDRLFVQAWHLRSLLPRTSR